MRHLDPTLNRIQDPDGLIPDDEPVLILRASNCLAGGVAMYYHRQLLAAGLTEQAGRALDWALEMQAWEHQALPELPPEGTPEAEAPLFENLASTSPEVAHTAGQLMHHQEPEVRQVAASAVAQAPRRKGKKAAASA